MATPAAKKKVAGCKSRAWGRPGDRHMSSAFHVSLRQPFSPSRPLELARLWFYLICLILARYIITPFSQYKGLFFQIHSFHLLSLGIHSAKGVEGAEESINFSKVNIVLLGQRVNIWLANIVCCWLPESIIYLVHPTKKSGFSLFGVGGRHLYFFLDFWRLEKKLFV